jgi:hypothetical protein
MGGHRAQEMSMRFLMYTLGDDSVPTPPPTPELMAEMGRFMEEATRAGALVATGAAAPSAEGITVTRTGDDYTVVDGPYAEAKELIGGWALMEARDKEEAVEWARRFLAIAGDGFTRIRQVYGAEG